MRRVGLKVAVVVAASLAVGCSDTEFKGSSTNKPIIKEEPIPTEKALSLTCTDGQTTAELEADVTGSSKTSVRLKGEFCNLEQVATSGELSVLFVLDFSGSMLDNDPLVSGTCGRLKAAEAINSKLEATAIQGANVRVGTLPFGNNALPGVALENVNSFKSRLTAENFCGSAAGGTNYEAALTRTKEILSPVTGAKVVYFISDGFPTLSGTGILGSIGLPQIGDLGDPQGAGTKAATDLRTQVQDLDLFGIYLGNSAPLGGGLPSPNPSLDPQAYMEQITGDKEKVRVVDNADDLADEIIELETPEVLTLDKSSVKGVHVTAGYGEKTIAIATLEKHPTRDGVWVFETEPFALHGESGREIKNEVTLTVRASDGTTQTAVAKINFTIEADAKTRIVQ